MKKEQIYINLQGKTKEELTDLWEFLKEHNEPTYNKSLINFIKDFRNTEYNNNGLEFHSKQWIGSYNDENKTEITIEQLKQIIKPMKFTPIAMKCNKEQFEAVKPKLTAYKSEIGSFKELTFLCNNLYGDNNVIANIYQSCKQDYNRIVHEEWNEEIFLKACGIEVETLQEQLQKAEAEVKRLQSLIDEENKPKVGDIGLFWDNDAPKKIGVLGKIYDNGKDRYKMNGSTCWKNFEKLPEELQKELPSYLK